MHLPRLTVSIAPMAAGAGAAGADGEGAAGADHIAVITVVGDIDVATGPQLQTAVEDFIAEGGRRIIIDLTGVGFVDSSGLGVLVVCQKKARFRGGWVRLVIVEPRVRRLFTITGLDTAFRLFRTVGDAGAASDG